MQEGRSQLIAQASSINCIAHEWRHRYLQNNTSNSILIADKNYKCTNDEQSTSRQRG